MADVEISYDPAKRDKTLRERGLDFDDAPQAFDMRSITLVDDRQDYGEDRYVTYGWLDDRAVAVTWIQRDGTLRIISMRHMHRWEVEHVGLD